MTNPAYIPQGTAPDWIKIADNGMWSMVGDAVKQDKANQETAAFNKQLADMFQQQSQQMHPLELDAKRAAADSSRAAAEYSRQLAATSADALAAQPPAADRKKVAVSKLDLDKAENEFKTFDTQFNNLAQAATMVKSQGLGALSQLPPALAQQLSQPGAADKVLAQHTMWQKQKPAFIQAMEQERIQQAGANSRNAATIAAQDKRAQNKTKPTDPFANIEKNITTKNGAYEAAISGKTLVEFMLSQIDTTNPENAPVVQDLQNKLARYTTIAQAAQAQRAKETNDKGNAAAQSGIDKTVGTINAVAPGTIKPNPAAAVPNQTNQVREQTQGLPSEALKQLKQGEITTFGNGQKWTIGKDGKPQKVN